MVYLFLALLSSFLQHPSFLTTSFVHHPSSSSSSHSFDSLNLLSSFPSFHSYNLPHYVSTSIPHQRNFHPDYIAILQSCECSNAIIEIILDTGTTFAITPHRSDFTSYTSSANPMAVATVGGSTSIIGYGTVDWNLISFDGTHHPITVPCHHVPQSKVRLLSPQDFTNFLQSDPGIDHYGGNQNWFWIHTTESKAQFLCPIEPRSNLPVALASVGHPQHSPHAQSNLSVLDETNQNLSQVQKELLFWHFRLGHFGFDYLQRLFRQGLLPSKYPSLSTCTPPKCAACQLARARRRNPDVRSSRPTKSNGIRNQLVPGEQVSIDQYVCPLRGRSRTARTISGGGQSFGGGTIFCDNATKLVMCSHQVSLGAHDSVRSKRFFERLARTHGVSIDNYHGDNGIFVSREFRLDLDDNEQQLTLSGVGAHHQNGIAERQIRTVVECARTLLHHSFLHWPAAFDQCLWPFALDHACWLYNRRPDRDSGWSPLELFSRSKSIHTELLRARVFMCPCYVLHPKLQDGMSIPKWEPRARLAQFLGFSQEHSSLVGLVRNLITEHISPQFHLVYDEQFSTVPAASGESTIPDDLFQQLILSIPSDDDPSSDEVSVPDVDDDDFLSISHIPPHVIDNLPAPPPTPDDIILFDDPSDDVAVTPVVYDADDPAASESVDPLDTPDPDLSDVDDTSVHDDAASVDGPILPAPPSSPSEGDDAALGRGKRIKFPNKWKYGGKARFVTIGSLTPSLIPIAPSSPNDSTSLVNLDWSIPFSASYAIFNYISELGIDPDTLEVDYWHPMTLAAKASSADEPRYFELFRLSSGELEEWFVSMETELDGLAEKKTYSIIDRNQVPDGHQIIKSTWVFRLKRRPDGTIIKKKSRFCVRGDIQELDLNELVYAPVVDWGTVRLVLIIAVAFGMYTKQIDFRNAFVQSSLPAPIYLELPQGFEQAGKVMKVFKSLYGDRRAPKLWFEFLVEILRSLGYLQSCLDPCLFFKKGIIFIFYVDDGIFVSQSQEQIDQAIADLRNATLDLEECDDYAGYLGIALDRQSDGSIHMLQTGLIDDILKDLGLTGTSRTKAVPAAGALGPCKESKPFCSPWNYRSVIGKLMYLANNTRCDIAFATHQCARFSNDPREPHGKAVIQIALYLSGTRTFGTFIRPTETMTLDCFADADFAGGFKVEESEDPRSARSRTGFVITLGGSPVVWGSRLQTETALSTMEAEYIALSTALRALIPLRTIFAELNEALSLLPPSVSIIHSTIWEDNNSTRILANSNPPRLTRRSKHIHTKYHWFREHLSPGIVDIKDIDTKDQLGDIFTKSLVPALLYPLRNRLLRWPPR